MNATFKDLLGKTIVKIEAKLENSDYDNPDYDELRFTTNEGKIYKQYHKQIGSEWVCIKDICGNLTNLLHNPILRAEEVINIDEEPVDYSDKSFTWTFCRLTTIKGSVTFKWYGFSNGNYSAEGVDFVEIAK